MGEAMEEMFDFECPICKEPFSNPNKLREHRLQVHKLKEVKIGL